MELKDEIRIRAPRAEVFAALNDPDVLKQAIPGCEALEASSPTDFKGTVTTKVGPLVARFVGTAQLSDIVAPESFTLTGEGKAGPVGFGKVRAFVDLVEEGEETLLRYTVKADIGGKLAQLGASMIERTSKKLSGEFFGKIETLLAPAAADADVGPLAEMASVNRDQAGGPRFNSLYVGIAALGALAGAAAIYFCVA